MSPRREGYPRNVNIADGLEQRIPNLFVSRIYASRGFPQGPKCDVGVVQTLESMLEVRRTQFLKAGFRF